MVLIKEVVNSVFTSKTYILYREGLELAWLVDIGDTEPVFSFLDEKQLKVAGVFITHGHFDHIYGLTSLVQRFPACKVFVTEYCKESLASDKLNLSRYHSAPMVFESDNVIIVHDGEKMPLFTEEPLMQFYETPGHNPGCLTMVMGDVLFTGDAYIPGVKVNTQLPHADKKLAQQSLERIIRLAEGKHVYSGHQV